MQHCSNVCIVLLANGKTHYSNFIGSALLLQNTYVVFACVPCRSCRRIDLVGRCQSLLHSNSSQTKSPPHWRSIIIMRMTTGVLTFVGHQRYVEQTLSPGTGGSSKTSVGCSLQQICILSQKGGIQTQAHYKIPLTTHK